MISRYINYIVLIIKHKYFVFVAGRKLKVGVFQLIMHDISKLSPSEFMGYLNRFYPSNYSNNERKCHYLAFAFSWVNHQNKNKHHWEYWITRSKGSTFNDNEPLEMPDKYVKEMVADWFGASRAYEGKFPTTNNYKWFRENVGYIESRMHPSSSEKMRYYVNILSLKMAKV